MSTKALLEAVCGLINDVFESKQQRIALCSTYRISCEGWLQIELLLRLTEAFSSDTHTVAYEANRVDLSISTPDKNILIELKTFPTNYGAYGKSITNSIDGVITDLQKLAARCDQRTVGIVVWLAYPIPKPEPLLWADHVHRVNAHASATLRINKISLWENQYAHLYIMESRRTGAAVGSAY